jgi:hypothetical protein
MLLFSSGFYTPYLLFDMTAFNLTGQGMQCNAEVGLFTKPSILVEGKVTMSAVSEGN